MELLKTITDLEMFNIHHDKLYHVNEKEWQNMPCAIFLDMYNRDEKTDSLLNESCFKQFLFNHLSDMSEFQDDIRKNFKGAYIINAIAFFTMETFTKYFTNEIPLTRENVMKNGLYLKKDHYLFRRFVEKYNHFGASWFDDYESS